MKYSVIVPVYNAEETIQRCLESLLYHIPQSAEVLVINDGSTDHSGEICRRFAEQYPALRYMEKENGGVSTARNLGLDCACGEYVLFVDSDDYVEPQYWETIDALIERYHPDMLQWGFRENGEIARERNTGDYVAVGVREVAQKIDAAIHDYLFSALWARAFRMDLVQKYKLRFDSRLAIGEDQVFIFSYALNVRCLVSISMVLYNSVLDNRESLSRKRRDYLTDQLMLANKIAFDLLEKAVLPSDIKQIYRGSLAWVYYRSAYSACKELLKYNLPKRERLKKITEICGLYGQKRVQATGIKCRVIAFPVVHKMGYIIDVLICRKLHRD